MKYFINILINQDHESSVKAIYNGAEFLESATAGAEVGIVLQSTSFYGEQGGQVLHSWTTWFINIPTFYGMICLTMMRFISVVDRVFGATWVPNEITNVSSLPKCAGLDLKENSGILIP